jgi:hypothetical protein
MPTEAKVIEEELVRSPAWRVRRGEERRDIRLCVIVNAKLHALIKREAERRNTTLSTFAEGVLAEAIKRLNAGQQDQAA